MTFLRNFIAAAALAGLSGVASAGYSGLYIFGDSLSDAGNNAIAIGTDPGQVITGNNYIPTFPYASGQYTNGNVWARSFASAIGLGAYGLPALGGGGNFAFGGARTGVDGAPPAYFPPSLKTQTSMYLSATGGFASANALYVVAGGGNDARDTIAAVAANPGNALAIIGAAAASYAFDTGMIVDTLQAAGAQHIVVWNTPNLGLAPAVNYYGLGSLGSLVASSMNAALAFRMSSETGVTQFDLYNVLAGYSFSNTTDACGAPSNAAVCPDVGTSLFWDGIHPTAAGHAALARSMVAAVVPEPETYALMLGGLALITWRARRRA